MITVERCERVAVIRLNRPPINALNSDLVARLADSLAEAAQSPEIDALVLAGAGEKFFCIGLDIPELFPFTKEKFGRFMHAFNQLTYQLLTFPKPAVAALRGHATAGGCILAIVCDYRIIAEGKKLMGLNEVKLGVPVPWVAARALVHLVGNRAAREIMDTGEFFGSSDLVRLGLVDRIVPMADVENAAIAQAASLGAHPEAAFARIKGDRLEALKEEILGRLDEKERVFLDAWYAPSTRERLREAMEKF